MQQLLPREHCQLHATAQRMDPYQPHTGQACGVWQVGGAVEQHATSRALQMLRTKHQTFGMEQLRQQLRTSTANSRSNAMICLRVSVYSD